MGRPPSLNLPPLGNGNQMRKCRPFPVSPKGEMPGWEGDPHAARSGRLPLQEGFQSALLKTPLLSPKSSDDNTSNSICFAFAAGTKQRYALADGPTISAA